MDYINEPEFKIGSQLANLDKYNDNIPKFDQPDNDPLIDRLDYDVEEELDETMVLEATQIYGSQETEVNCLLENSQRPSKFIKTC
jgi:hypothetical protein